MADRMTDDERAAATVDVVAEALAAIRADDPGTANGLLAHAVHAGMQPHELLAEIVAQTGGTL